MIKLVEVRQVNGSSYLLIPKKHAEQIGVKQGQGYAVTVDENGILYRKIQPIEADSEPVVEVEA